MGVEPTLPPYQDGRLPLQHGGIHSRAPSGSRTRTSAMARRQAAATSWAHIQTTRTVEAVGVEPTSSCLRDRCLAGVGHTSSSSAPPMGFEPTTFPVTGERPLRAGPRGRMYQPVVGTGVEPAVTALSERCLAAWLPHKVLRAALSRTASSVPRAGVEPGLGGLKGRRPHPKSNGASRSRHETQHETQPAGGLMNPRPVRVPHLAQRVTRSHPGSSDPSRPRRLARHTRLRGGASSRRSRR